MTAFLKKKAYPAMVLFLMSLAIVMESPLSIWDHSLPWIDSSVFKYIGRLIKQGGMPYRDSFDHKGPLLYLIEYAGALIADMRGVWILELLFMLVTAYFLYRTARLFCEISWALLATCSALAFLPPYFEGGNLSEEYALAFIAAGGWIFAEYMLKDRISPLRVAACGACCAAVLLLRANMIALWIVFCIGSAVLLLREKKWRELGRFTGLFLLGMLAVCLPVLIWLTAGGALRDFFAQYILFNLRYTAGEEQAGMQSARLSALSCFLSPPSILFALLLCILAAWQKKQPIYWLQLLYFVGNILLMAMSGRDYPHYGMLLVPSLLLPFALCLRALYEERQRATNLVLLFALLVVGPMPQWLFLAENMAISYVQRKDADYPDYAKELVALVQENSGEDEPISVYGNLDWVYLLSERKSVSRYSYQFPIGELSEEIFDAYFAELNAAGDVLLVVQGEYAGEARIVEYLFSHSYGRIWEDQASGIELWRVKQ